MLTSYEGYRRIVGLLPDIAFWYLRRKSCGDEVCRKECIPSELVVSHAGD